MNTQLKVIIVIGLLLALVATKKENPVSFESAIRGQNCQGQDFSQCKFHPAKEFLKGNKTHEKQLRDMYNSMELKTIEEAEQKAEALRKKKEQKMGIPEEAAEKFNNEKKRRGKKPNSNKRKLFSVNSQVPGVNEGDFVAYEHNFIYRVDGQDFTIYKVESGAVVSVLYSSTLPSQNEYSYDLVVKNGIIAIVAHNYQDYTVKVYLKHHDIQNGSVSDIEEYTREGDLVSVREFNGQLTLVIQHWNFTDLTWDSLAGTIYTEFTGCTSWAGGNYVRDIATISLSTQPTYSFATFYGCDYTSLTVLSPTGNWYILSTYWDTTQNTIIQKLPMNNLLLAEYAAMYDAYVYNPNRLDEEFGCELRVAAESYTNPQSLRFYRFGCAPFRHILDGYYGVLNVPVYAILWSNEYAYASFGNKHMIKYDAKDFTVANYIRQKHYIYSLYEYGQRHIIGLGENYQDTFPRQYEVDVVLFEKAGCGFQQKMEYRIVPSSPEKNVYGYTWESGHLYVNIDYANRMVVIPVFSTESQPFTSGFFYIHVEVDSADPNNCMIHPPITQCAFPVGQSFTKSFTPVGRLYKHWDPPTTMWPGNEFSQVISRALVVRDTERYLVTLSYCQLQVRVHPNDVVGGGLPLAPAFNLDLCQ